jgi:hypothetical protein
LIDLAVRNLALFGQDRGPKRTFVIQAWRGPKLQGQVSGGLFSGVLFAAGEAQYQLPRGFDDGRVCGGSPRGHLHLPA